MFGHYNFNKCPLAPPGTKVILHQNLDQCSSWEYHGYQALCWVPNTGSKVDADTLTMIPTT
eukprot:5592968-Ditylum_brightwellii.AAC.1